jgi:hypothetical protein
MYIENNNMANMVKSYFLVFDKKQTVAYTTSVIKTVGF